MTNNKTFAVMDAGAEEIFVLAASRSKNGDHTLEGFNRVPRAVSPGDKDGGLYPPAENVREALDGLSRKTGKRFHKVYAGISSPSVKVISSSGSVLISRYGREVNFRDIRKCIDIGSLCRIPLDREVLHKIVTGFSVDGESPIRDPEGLEAMKLGVNVNMLTINATTLGNMSRVISRAGYIPAGFVFSPFACSFRVFAEEDRMDRTAFIVPHRKRTEILLFSFGDLEDCKVLDRSIEDSANTPGYSDADEKYGWLAEEITSMNGWRKMRRIVIPGARFPSEEFMRFMETTFGMPLRVGFPSARPFEGLPEDAPGYAAALGILDHLRNEAQGMSGRGSPAKRLFHQVAGFLDEYF